MKILGINGSHRKDSNTSMMIEKALNICRENGFETQQIDISHKDIKYCTVCDLCKRGFKCSLNDDAFEIIEAMNSADAIIIGSPTYFGDITGMLKSLFDRTLPLRRNGIMLAGKVGAALATGGSRNGGQEKAISAIQSWMLIHQMTIVGDAKTAHFGGICISQAPGSVLDDEHGIETVKNTANNLCSILIGPKGN